MDKMNDSTARVRRRVRLALSVWLFLAGGAAAAETYSFGVLPQRSAVLTAQYWNPILRYVADRTGVVLELRVARSGDESKAAAGRGDYDFIYSNHIFEPAVAPAGYRVLLRPRAEAIRAQLVVLDTAAVRAPEDLAGKTVGFPSRAAFVGYAVPMDFLVRHGIAVTPVFGGNQEGIMGQLKSGKVIAAGVNGPLMADFAAREHLHYRALWESTPFYNLPIAVHPRVANAVARAVQKAIDAMDEDAEGRRILAASARVIGQAPPFGFKESTQADYRNYLEFFQTTVLKDLE